MALSDRLSAQQRVEQTREPGPLRYMTDNDEGPILSSDGYGSFIGACRARVAKVQPDWVAGTFFQPASNGSPWWGTCSTRRPISGQVEFMGYAMYMRLCPRGYSGVNYDTYQVNYANGNWWYGGNAVYCRAGYTLIENDRTSKPFGACPVGNPVNPATGVKTEEFPLDVGVEGLSLALRYDSGFQIRNTTVVNPGEEYRATTTPVPRTQAGGLGLPAGWRLNAHTKVFLGAKVGSNFVAAKLVRSDGAVETYPTLYGNGVSYPDPEVINRLAWIDLTALRYYDVTRGAMSTFNLWNDAYVAHTRFVDGRQTWFGYSNAATPPNVAPGREYLIAVADLASRSVSFKYELPPGANPASGGRLKEVIGPDGRITTLTYDQGGRLSGLRWPDGTVKTLHYEDPQFPLGLTGVTDESGRRVSQFAFDSHGRVTSTSRAGGALRYALSFSSPPSIEMREVVNPATATINRYFEWVGEGTVSIQTPNGAMSTIGTALSNGLPLVSGRGQPAGSGCDASSSAIERDVVGNAVRVDDFNGSRTCRTFVSSRNLLETEVSGLASAVQCSDVAAASAAVPAGARKVSRQWHPVWRLETKVAEPLRLRTNVYNGQPDPFAANAVANCASGAKLQDGSALPVLCKSVVQATTDPDGGLGVSAPLDPNVPSRTGRYRYHVGPRLLTATDARGNATTYSYYGTSSFSGADPYAFGVGKGDLQTVTNPAGHVTRYTQYDKHGQWLQMIDPNGVVTNRTFDARRRLSTVSVGGELTTYDYWPNGLQKKLSLPDGSSMSYEYDDAQRLIAVSDNLGNRIDYVLDNAGNRIAENAKDPGGGLRRALTRSFDALNRMQQLVGREVAP